ncbi:hypothetical protein Tco_1428232 [Tanacetum coccineum]
MQRFAYPAVLNWRRVAQSGELLNTQRFAYTAFFGTGYLGLYILEYKFLKETLAVCKLLRRFVPNIIRGGLLNCFRGGFALAARSCVQRVASKISQAIVALIPRGGFALQRVVERTNGEIILSPLRRNFQMGTVSVVLLEELRVALQQGPGIPKDIYSLHQSLYWTPKDIWGKQEIDSWKVPELTKAKATSDSVYFIGQYATNAPSPGEWSSTGMYEEKTSNRAEIEKKNLIIENENMIVNCLSIKLLYDVGKISCLDLEVTYVKVHDESKLFQNLKGFKNKDNVDWTLERILGAYCECKSREPSYSAVDVNALLNNMIATD